MRRIRKNEILTAFVLSCRAAVPSLPLFHHCITTLLHID